MDFVTKNGDFSMILMLNLKEYIQHTQYAIGYFSDISYTMCVKRYPNGEGQPSKGSSESRLLFLDRH